MTNRFGLDDIREAKHQRNAEVKRAVDQGARDPLVLTGDVCGDEDVGDVKGDVEADGGANHRRKYKRPIAPADRDQCEEETRSQEADRRDDHQDRAGYLVEDKSADGRDENPSHS